MFFFIIFFIKLASHTAGVLARTPASAVSSVKSFGWAALKKAASNRPVPNRQQNGHCTGGCLAEDPGKCSVESGNLFG